VKTPRDLLSLAMSQVFYKERTKTTIATKNCTSKVGLSRFPNIEHKAFQLTNGEILNEKFQQSRKNTHCNSLKS
jgi:hypothetical protein